MDRHLPSKTDFNVNQGSTSKEFSLKQRPNSGNGRDPLYQTQKSNLESMKYDNLMMGKSDGFTAG